MPDHGRKASTKADVLHPLKNNLNMNVRLLERVSELTSGMDFYEFQDMDVFPTLTDKVRQLEQGITELNDVIRNYSFNGVDEEITFFKEVKPLLMKEYVFLINLQDFYQKYADLEIQQPKVYKKEINRLMHFIRGEKKTFIPISKANILITMKGISGGLPIRVWHTRNTASTPICSRVVHTDCYMRNCWRMKNLLHFTVGSLKG